MACLNSDSSSHSWCILSDFWFCLFAKVSHFLIVLFSQRIFYKKIFHNLDILLAKMITESLPLHRASSRKKRVVTFLTKCSQELLAK